MKLILYVVLGFLFHLVGAQTTWNYDPATVESHVALNCRQVTSQNEFDGLKLCHDHVKAFSRLMKVSFDGVNADVQSTQFQSGALFNTMWYTNARQFSTICLGAADDRYCRNKVICSMKETFWGRIYGPDSFFTNPYLLSNKNINGNDRLQPIQTERCINCQFVPCPYWNCPNGRVNGRPLETVAGKVVRLPECGVACSAGRFLTCSAAGRCEYQVYTQENARQDQQSALSGSSRWFGENVNILKVGLNVIDVADARPPVTDCYPCRLADKRNHGGIPYITDDSLYAAGFLSFTCPGGDALPVSCGLNRVSKFDAATETGSACGCMPRYYHNSTLGICAPCPPGFKCAWNGMTPPTPVLCEPDTYSKGGEEACTPCNTNQAACSNGDALTSCRYGAQNPYFQSQDARCVRCEQCTQLGGSTPCYGVTPKVFS